MIQKEWVHLLMASMKWKWCQHNHVGKGKTVLLDRYFNSEKRKDAAGDMSVLALCMG